MAQGDRDVSVSVNANVDSYQRAMQQAQATTNGLIGVLDKLVTTIDSVWVKAGRTLRIFGGGVDASLLGMAAAAAKFESSLSDVRSTAAITGQSVNAVAQSAGKLSATLPMSQGQIAQLMGQIMSLGVQGTANITRFTEAAVKLGAATQQDPGQLINGLTNLMRTMGSNFQNVDRYSSALVELSKQNGVSASSILDFSQAISAVGQRAGMTQQTVTSLATGFQKAGADGYTAASLFNKIITDIDNSILVGSPRMNEYASLLGMTVKQFKDLANNHPEQAFIDVIQKIKDQGQNGLITLSQLGLDDPRASRAIAQLTGPGINLQQILGQGNKAFSDNTALNKSSSAAWDDLSTSITKFRDAMTKVVQDLGGPLLGGLNMGVKGATGLVDAFNAIPAPLKAVITWSAGAGASLLALGGVALGLTATIMKLGFAWRLLFSGTAMGLAGGVKSGLMGGATAAETRAAATAEGGTMGMLPYMLFGAGRGVGQAGGKVASFFMRGAGGEAMTQEEINAAMMGRLRAGAGDVLSAPFMFARGQYRMGKEGLKHPFDPSQRQRYDWAGRPIEEGGSFFGGKGAGQAPEEAARARPGMAAAERSRWGSMWPDISYTGAGAANAEAETAERGALRNGISNAARGAGNLASGFASLLPSLAGIGVAAAILIPTINSMSDRAKKAAADMGNIGQAGAKARGGSWATGGSTGQGGQAADSNTPFSKTEIDNARGADFGKTMHDDISALRVTNNPDEGRQFAMQWVGQTIAHGGSMDDNAKAQLRELLIRQYGVQQAQTIYNKVSGDTKGFTNVTYGQTTDALRSTLGGARSDANRAVNTWAGNQAQQGLRASTGQFVQGDTGQQVQSLLTAQSTLGSGNGFNAYFQQLVDSWNKQNPGSTLSNLGDVNSVKDVNGFLNALKGGNEQSVQLYNSLLPQLQQSGFNFNGSGNPNGIQETQVATDALSRLAQQADQAANNLGKVPAGAPPPPPLGEGPGSTTTTNLQWANALKGAGIDPNDPKSWLADSQWFQTQQTALGNNLFGGPMSLNGTDQSTQGLANVSSRIAAINNDKAPESVALQQQQGVGLQRFQSQIQFMQPQRQMGQYAGLLNAIPDNALNDPANQAAAQNVAQAAAGAQQQALSQLAQYVQAEKQYHIQEERNLEDHNLQLDHMMRDHNRQVAESNYQFEHQQAESLYQYNKSVQEAQYQYGKQQTEAQYQFGLQRREALYSNNIQEREALYQRNQQLVEANHQYTESIRQMTLETSSAFDAFHTTQSQWYMPAGEALQNAQRQNDFMQRSKSGVDQLRGKYGLSNAVISQLNLNDPKNFQQVEQFLTDFANNPSLAKAWNDTIAKRLNLANAITVDPSNQKFVEMKRAFDWSAAQASNAFDHSQGLMRESFQHSQDLMTQNYTHSQAIQADAFAHSQQLQSESFAHAQDQAQQQFQHSMKVNEDNFHIALADFQQAFTTSQQRAAQDMETMTQNLSMSMTELFDRASKSGVKGIRDMAQQIKDGTGDVQRAVDRVTSAGINAQLFANISSNPNAIGGPQSVSSPGSPAATFGGPPSMASYSGAVQAQQNAGETINSLLSGPVGNHQSGASGDAAFRGHHGETGWMGILGAVANLGIPFGMPTPDQLYQRGGGEHAAGRAADFGDATSDSARIARALLPYARGKNAPIDELIYSPLGIGYKNGVNIGAAGYGPVTWGEHFNHVHVGVKPGVSLEDATPGGGGTLGELIAAGLKLPVDLGKFGSIDARGNFISKEWFHSDGNAPGANTVAEARRAMADMYPSRVAQYKGFATDVEGILTNLATQQGLLTGGGSAPGYGGGGTPEMRAYAQSRLAAHGWGGQMSMLDYIISHESGWDPTISNGGGHGYSPGRAYGIPQALPGDKMSAAGPDWMTNPLTQLHWMIDQYIPQAYGNLQNAYNFWLGHHAYAQGGIATSPHMGLVGEAGPELMLPLNAQGAAFISTIVRMQNANADARSARMSGYSSPVQYISNGDVAYHYDSSQNFNGPITVQAQDPNAMARALEARSRLQRLRTPSQVTR